MEVTLKESEKEYENMDYLLEKIHVLLVLDIQNNKQW